MEMRLHTLAWTIPLWILASSASMMPALFWWPLPMASMTFPTLDGQEGQTVMAEGLEFGVWGVCSGFRFLNKASSE